MKKNNPNSFAFPTLVDLLPELGELVKEAKAINPKPGEPFCANEAWHLYLKPKLARLVGWDREPSGIKVEDDFFGRSDVYDLAYHTIYDMLPECRGCACFTPFKG